MEESAYARTSAITNDKDLLPESSRKQLLSWKEEEVAAPKELFVDAIKKSIKECLTRLGVNGCSKIPSMTRRRHEQQSFM